MPRYIPLSTPSGIATQTSIYARISTPSNPCADTIDPNFQTVVLIHPIWMDGFFFYPQLEDPDLSSRFNLVALDARGHGQTNSASLDSGYDAWTAAEDINSALAKLKVGSLPHIIAASTGCVAATRFASKYLCASLTCIGLASPDETEDNIAGFNDVCEVHLQAICANDSEALHDFARASVSFGINDRDIEPIRELCVSYATENFNWHEGNVEQYVGYVYEPVTKRQALTQRDISKIQCPVLLLHGADDAVYPPATSHSFHTHLILNRPNSLAPVITELIPESPHWCSLSAPNLINPLLLSFLTDFTIPPPSRPSSPVSNPPLTPNTPEFGIRKGQGIARRPSTPRDAEFNITKMPKVQQGVVTVGDMEQIYLRGLKNANSNAAMGAVGRRPSVVDMTVEILVVDEEGREIS